MTRQELFADIKAKIESEVPEVKHIDLWNHNVEFIEQEEGWARPALFVEFGPIEWNVLQKAGMALRGHGELRLHIVTDWAEGGHGAAFALSKQTAEVMAGMEGEHYDSLTLVQTATNHNHEELLESIDTYAVRYVR